LRNNANWKGRANVVSNKWDLDSARHCIMRNGGGVSGRTIEMETAGLHILGAIDYLVHYEKFIWVHQSPKKSKHKREEE